MTDAHPLGPNPEKDVVNFDPASPVYQLLEVTVSPKLATDILETRAPNRPIRQKRVEQYAADMKRGHWLRNGQTIKFDRFGRLLDGQHRLWGIIEADVAVDMTVALGLEPEAMATVDTGMPRMFSDVIAINGAVNARQVASVIRLIWTYEHDEWGNPSPSHIDLAATMSRFPDIVEQVSYFKTRLQRLGQTSPLAFMLYMGHRLDKAKGEAMVDGLMTGSNLEVGDPVLALRERLITLRSDKSERITRPDYIVAMLIKAWNAHLASREILKLSWQWSREPRPLFDPPVPGLKNPAPARKIKNA